jgi:hypothetical protein
MLRNYLIGKSVDQITSTFVNQILEKENGAKENPNGNVLKII